MPFKSGHKKIAGRQIGSLNKTTLIVDTFAKTVVEQGMQRYLDEMEKLKGKAYVDAFLSVFEYVKPKLARIDTNVTGEITINWHEEKNYAIKPEADSGT